MSKHDMKKSPVHLGLGATAVVEPAFEGEGNWYEDYGRRHADDGAEGRLVSMYMFHEPWPTWEMHPMGAEVVLCVAGRMTLHQELLDGSTRTVDLGPGEYAINDPGVWHTADVAGEASALFITAGAGTEIRPR